MKANIGEKVAAQWKGKSAVYRLQGSITISRDMTAAQCAHRIMEVPRIK